MFNDLLGPLIFTVVKLKKQPAITSSVSYDMGSCPFTLVTAVLKDHNYVCHSDIKSVIITCK